MHCRNQHQHAVVGDLGHVQSAVLRWNFQAKTAEFGKTFDILVWNPRLTLDDGAVDGIEEFPQLSQKGLGASRLVARRPGKRMDQLQRKPTEEQFLGEEGFPNRFRVTPQLRPVPAPR